MNPIEFPQANKVLKAPVGQEASVAALPVMCDGEMCVSCWQPTPEERALIAAGQPVFLYVHSGETQPPVTLAVLSLSGKPAPAPEPPAASGDQPQAFAA